MIVMIFGCFGIVASVVAASAPQPKPVIGNWSTRISELTP
jgi:hypothetical protein